MPQFNPEHVIFIQNSLLLQAIFRLIPDLKKTMYSQKYTSYIEKSIPGRQRYITIRHSAWIV